MTNNLTQRQQAVIISEELTKNRNISLDMSLHADLVLLMRDNPERFNGNFSAIIREACYCYLHYGLDWRSGDNSNNEILKVIREEIGRLKVVESTEDRLATNEKIDDAEGFFTE